MLYDNKIYRRHDRSKKAKEWCREYKSDRYYYDDADHLGVENMLKRIREIIGSRAWDASWLNMLRYAWTALITSTQWARGKLNNIDKTSIPFHTVHLDHVGSFETNRKYNKFLLVIDTFTKFVIIEPVKSQKASQVIKILNTIIHLFGIPRLITDRRTIFTSHIQNVLRIPWY